MVTKVELKLALADTSLEWLLSHVVTLNGDVYHYIMKDRMTTPCGYAILGANVLQIEQMEVQLCARCIRIVRSLTKE